MKKLSLINAVMIAMGLGAELFAWRRMSLGDDDKITLDEIPGMGLPFQNAARAVTGVDVDVSITVGSGGETVDVKTVDLFSLVVDFGAKVRQWYEKSHADGKISVHEWAALGALFGEAIEASAGVAVDVQISLPGEPPADEAVAA